MNLLHQLLQISVDILILLFEWIGVLILGISGVRGVLQYFSGNPLTRLQLAKGMAMGLEFKLGSEILRTVVVRKLTELLMVAGIVLLRAALTFLIHWEIANEEAHTKKAPPELDGKIK